ncbi:hypothetical protein JQC67_16135 [Aurantibacter crassamenti]|uniref:hypothetical protein n=1 Tax=Aurantibacter crassamenti TaxID=1837375 RepID=UPI001939B326|nr:hypothetical protein [Aurantibacter crassamenti]MBM1107687.1 hypothetical protein [Aurantibacter crassamenti]
MMKKVIILSFLFMTLIAHSQTKPFSPLVTLNEVNGDTVVVKWASEFNLLPTNIPSKNTTAFRAIFSANENGNLKVVHIKKGVYNLDDSVYPNGIKDFKIVAEKGVVLNITTDEPIVDSRLNSGGISNLYIENLTFSSSYSGTTNENNNPALFFVGATPIKNITFKDVSWTAPSGCITGFKSANETIYKSESIHFINNKWFDISQMAIEFINHVEPTVSRYNDIKVLGGSINNIGLHGTNGIGISFSGRGENNAVKNVIFNNIPVTAIENIGSWNTTYSGNVFQTNVERPILITNTNQKRNIRIENNIDVEQELDGNGMEFTNIDGLIMSGNTFYTGIYFNNVVNVTVTDDIWVSDVYGTLFIDGKSGEFDFNNVTIENNSEGNPAIITNNDSIGRVDFKNGYIKYNGPKFTHTGKGTGTINIKNSVTKEGENTAVVENP